MKEVERVSIGGYAFTLEKDATEAAKAYLTELEAHYLGQEGGKEIMEGIEERMAELLLERSTPGGAVTLSAVQSVIDILGRPERIEADDPAPQAGPQAEKPRKKLYRDLERKQLGGVCAGLANYFDIDVAWLRMGFIVLTAAFFFGLIHSTWSLWVPGL